ncbi:HigA family addiction module antitoxin [Rothia nasimurium]|uniref:HigA family addiction module antitoxin n=1 Tax=Rothia nasimurium TaxID=85336 RepID=UPI001EFF9280|nr:HigA family addiction module antitoxin [Rothia nasimurium]
MTIAQAFPVGEYLSDELEARGWSQQDFAEIIGRPVQFISEIISGKRELTKESAAQIAMAFGASPELWLNLQTQYQVWVQSQDADFQEKLSNIERKARQRELAPVSLLIKRGIVQAGTLDEIDQQLLDLYEVDSFDTKSSYSLAARKTDSTDEISATQLAWALSVRKKAKIAQENIGEYSLANFENLSEKIAKISVAPERFIDLQELFFAAGVGLFYVENFPGAKIDGVTFMLGNNPIIGLSGRGKRLDKVFFTLCHEMSHILNKDVSETEFRVDENLGSGIDLNVQETAADIRASKIILAGEELSDPPVNIRADWVNKEAERLGVHPIIVVGRLQSQGKLDWRTTLAKGAPNVDQYMLEWK